MSVILNYFRVFSPNEANKIELSNSSQLACCENASFYPEESKLMLRSGMVSLNGQSPFILFYAQIQTCGLLAKYIGVFVFKISTHT